MDRNQNDRHVEAFDVEYKGYILKCRPQPTPQGQFLAFVILMPKIAGTSAAASLMPDVPGFENRADAFRCAVAAGKRWVDAHG